MRHRKMTANVPVKMRQVQLPEPRSAKNEREKAEAKTDCETDQVKI
jgi:hypothetical protein